MNLSKNIKIARVMNAVAAGTGDQNCAVVDMQGFDGVMFVASFGALTAGTVTAIKAQQGTVADGSDMADLAGTRLAIDPTASNKALVLDLYRPTERYVRCVITRATANAAIDGVTAILYDSRTKATAHDATVAASLLAISPVEGTA